MTEHKYREHCKPRAADERPLAFSIVKLNEGSRAVTAIDGLQRMKDGRSSGVLALLPAATD